MLSGKTVLPTQAKANKKQLQKWVGYSYVSNTLLCVPICIFCSRFQPGINFSHLQHLNLNYAKVCMLGCVEFSAILAYYLAVHLERPMLNNVAVHLEFSVFST
jgi:hypothetical protein